MASTQTTASTCGILQCSNPPDFVDIVSTPPVIYYNSAQTYDVGCSESEVESLNYSGNLPSWITISEGNVIAKAGVFSATSQEDADAAALTTLTNWAEAAIAAGDLECLTCNLDVIGGVALDGGGNSFDCYDEGSASALPNAGINMSGTWETGGSPQIELLQISGDGDKRMRLDGGDSCSQLIGIDSTWTKLRIGWRFAITDTGANIVTAPNGPIGYFGLLSNPASGMTNGPLGALTSHFLGVSSGNTPFAGTTWTRGTSGGLVYYTLNPTTFYSLKKVGATVTSSSSQLCVLSASPSQVRTAMFIQITKGSPNYTIDQIWAINSSALVDIPKATFEAAIQQADPAGYLNTFIGAAGYATNLGASIAVNEAVDGTLNSLCAAWNEASAFWHISDFAFAKLA